MTQEALTPVRLDRFNTRIYNSGTIVMYTENRGGSRISARHARTFQGGTRVYRVKPTKVKSAAVDLWRTRRGRTVLFFTVTCPHEVEEKQAAKAWNLFLKNLWVNRGVKKYVWVKERQTQNNGRIHYHIIIDKVYLNIRYLQRAWNSSYASATGHVPTYSNSVRLGSRPIVNDIDAVAGYLSKYISKGLIEGEEPFNSRCYGYTNNLILYRDVDTTVTYEKIGERNPFTIFAEAYLVVMAVTATEARSIVVEYDSS